MEIDTNRPKLKDELKFEAIIDALVAVGEFNRSGEREQFREWRKNWSWLVEKEKVEG